MASRGTVQDVTTSIIEACHRGYAPERLKTEVLARMRRVLPVDALWWATSDPATLLFTQAFREGIPDRTTGDFINNEFRGHDHNQWTELAQNAVGVRTLFRATGDDLHASARYRDLLEPLGLGDELRAVLRTGDTCWGLMCLHREIGHTFSDPEVSFIKRLTPHLAEGLRAGLLMPAVTRPTPDAPGLVVLDRSGELIAATEAARIWFAELGQPSADTGVPAEVRTAAALLRRPDNNHQPEVAARVPRLRLRTKAGQWIVLHASRLSGPHGDGGQIAVIIEPATPTEVAAVIMRAYGLTERERAVTGLLCTGRSTAQITAELWISPNTLQDHLKSVFNKTGVHSRREVMAAILRDHYLPGLKSSHPVDPAGYFTLPLGVASAPTLSDPGSIPKARAVPIAARKRVR
ncbi:MAG: helix-turn-helix transcriptional regulator [Actinomycetota bacterium]|nr:helix-turn-helix transcriptional regulator [Actinomycetota bacterium]